MAYPRFKKAARWGFRTIFLANLLALGSCSATPALSAANHGTTVKVSALPSPMAGTLGLSSLIKPFDEWINLFVFYPDSARNQFKGNISCTIVGYVFFTCVQPTKRIVVNANPEWELELVRLDLLPDKKPWGTIKQVSFNADDGTLYVDLEEYMQTNVSYHLVIKLAPQIINQEDRFGIQAFQRSHHDSGDELITVSLSSAPNAMRRLVPCFDDPDYTITYGWDIFIFHGSYPTPIATMNGEMTRANHTCMENVLENSSVYRFHLPQMTVEMTQLRIGPFSWYKAGFASKPCSARR